MEYNLGQARAEAGLFFFFFFPAGDTTEKQCQALLAETQKL